MILVSKLANDGNGRSVNAEISSDSQNTSSGMDPDNRLAFWTQYYERKDEGPPEGISFDTLINDLENALRTRFASELQNLLSSSFDRVAVIVRSIDYGSLNIGLDLIIGAFTAAGFTIDDLLALLMQFTPVALDQTLGFGTSNIVNVGAEIAPVPAPMAAPQAPDAPAATAAPPAPTAPQAQPRLTLVWWIANTSLVLTALVLAGAAILVFSGAQDEKRILLEAAKEDRARFTQAIIAEHDQLNKALIQQQADLTSFCRNS